MFLILMQSTPTLKASTFRRTPVSGVSMFPTP
jgi:hypothetical protein